MPKLHQFRGGKWIEIGLDGRDGLSAYELAKKEGFKGTISQWMDSLTGLPGTPGNDGETPIKGVDYFDGAPGKDAVDPEFTVEKDSLYVKEPNGTWKFLIDFSKFVKKYIGSGGGGSGVMGTILTDFLALLDTPDSYVGKGGKVVSVKESEDGLEFTTGTGGSGSATIPQYDVDPVSPSPEDVWVHKKTEGRGAIMAFIGMGFPISRSEPSTTYELTYRTLEGTNKRVKLA